MIPTWSEMDGFPKETRGSSGLSATRKLKGPWSDRINKNNELSEHPRELYPYPRPLGARVTSITIDGFGKSGPDASDPSMISYEEAILTVQYKTPDVSDPQPHPDPSQTNNPQAVISETFEPYTEANRLNFEKYVWSDGTKISDAEVPFRTVHRAKYGITRYNLTNVPSLAVDYISKMNNADITPLLLGNQIKFLKNTLLFEPPKISISVNSNNVAIYTVAYAFFYKEEGWNKFWRSDKEAYFKLHHIPPDVNVNGTAEYLQPVEADFSLIYP